MYLGVYFFRTHTLLTIQEYQKFYDFSTLILLFDDIFKVVTQIYIFKLLINIKSSYLYIGYNHKIIFTILIYCIVFEKFVIRFHIYIYISW